MMVQSITNNKVMLCLLALTLTSTQASLFKPNENKFREYLDSKQTFHRDGLNLQSGTSGICNFGYAMMDAGASYWESSLGDYIREYTTVQSSSGYGS
jgi:hypothetical protein